MRNDQESAKARLLKAARVLLIKECGEEAALLLDPLFDGSDAEDISVYSAQEIAAFTHDAYQALKNYHSDKPAIRIYDPDFPNIDNGHFSNISIIEIHNNNMPFLMDSILSELQVTDVDLQLVLHPVLTVERSKNGLLETLLDPTSPDVPRNATKESFIQVHVTRLANKAEKMAIEERLGKVLSDVHLAVSDWRSMILRLQEAISGYRKSPPPIPAEEVVETVHFLEWLVEDNFTFLGMRDYSFEGGSETGDLISVEDGGLGLLSNPDVRVLRRGSDLVTITPEIREFLNKPECLIITKANVKTTVHRRSYMDYIGIKLFDSEGNLTGELRIVGLFTSTAYTRSTLQIPFLRRKVANVMARAGYDSDSHSGKALLNVLEGYPRDELFQISAKQLTGFALDILRLIARPRIRVLSRRDKFDRFVSVMIFVPRDRYNTDVRIKIGEYLKDIYDGRVSAIYPSFPEGGLARVHFIIGRSEGETPHPQRKELELAVTNIIRTWRDHLSDQLQKSGDPIKARILTQRYGEAFPVSYRDLFLPKAAVSDICMLETLSNKRHTAIEFYRKENDADNRVALTIMHSDTPVPLSERVPILENMGFRVIDERSYEITPSGGRSVVWLHDMELEKSSGDAVDLEKGSHHLRDCFLAIWYGQAENDGYNALVVNAGIQWRDIAMLRTISRYLRQVRIPYSQDYMWDTLNRYPDIAGLIVDLFKARFNPKKTGRKTETERLVAGLTTILGSVSNLDDDRILRRFAEVIQAALRTNFYQLDDEGLQQPTIALKLDPRAMQEMPEPRPFREIFVYSPQVEGVHMRFGKVARGGLRWSDRPQDFRTEVLGLVKAQQVKNAVIVPVGAKGGFYPKKLPTSGGREAFMAEGISSYKIFISALLQVTDNLDGDLVLPPNQVVRHDGDDPYLVVAADKGTATFSDTANSISQANEYWLDDAFASGGSAGYDHKKMGITARGAWEAVKRHFREMDRDIQTEPFSAIGVGDMSGDVFGNGMLLSKSTRLMAAFDHRDIFIDPDPKDLDASWTERKRLFDMGRSSWKDYDPSLISKGGGVFSRSEKSIKLSAPIRKLLQIDKPAATPNELLRAILKSEADLLWFGGIGTYARASSETNVDAGDKANDSIRVMAKELRVKVIGEGANLGVTQLARIEFHENGGRCNSDAIDNSAGVNSSDMEVNIKIAFGSAVRAGKLDTPARNILLAKMTDEVAALVLRNNYLQTLSLSMTERRGMEDFAYQKRLMEILESMDLLNREVEQLPDDVSILKHEQSGVPLSRAEIGVLLAYAKLTLYDQLLADDVPDQDYLEKELVEYFPRAMQKNFHGEINSHRLKREIIATVIANSMINRGGTTLVARLADQTGATGSEIAVAYVAVRDSFAMRAINSRIDALDNQVSGDIQLKLYMAVQDVLLEQIQWFLRNTKQTKTLADTVSHFQNGISKLGKKVHSYLPAYLQNKISQDKKIYVDAGVPEELAEEIAGLPTIARISDIILVADRAGKPLDLCALAYFDVAGHFRIGRIDAIARNLDVSDYYDSLALDRARDLLAESHRKMTAQILALAKGKKSGLEVWLSDNEKVVKRTLDSVNAIIESDDLSVSKISVAAGLLADLSRT